MMRLCCYEILFCGDEIVTSYIGRKKYRVCGCNRMSVLRLFFLARCHWVTQPPWLCWHLGKKGIE